MSHHMLSGARPRALAVAVTLACLTPAAMAAGRQDMHAANLAQLQAHYSSLVAAKGVSSMAHTRHEQLIGADAETRLVLTYRDTSHGVRNTRYQQTFRGIPVYGESIVVSEDAASGKLRTLFGRQVTGLAAEIADAPSKVFKGQALAIAKRAALGSRLGAMQTHNEKSELMIYVDGAGHAHKAYVVNFFADSRLAGNKPTRPYVIVDANSGKVLKQWEGLTTALVGTGPGGNAKTGQYEWGSGGIYGYMDVTQSGSTCTMNNSVVKAVNLNHGTSGSTAFSYTCPRNTYQTINSGYSPINDAFYFGKVIQNMYNAYTGVNALSFQLVMRVHYKTNYENAFWDGSTMNFGDGASTFYPLVSADVGGHEVSHGFTEQHSNLCYDDGSQCGGMNEAFSDMGGEATEYYWKGTNDFLVGQEIFKGSASQALRYMCNPPQDGGSIDNASDMTSSIDPHYSSGVYNKAFCTLAKTSGWNTQKAFQVMARANANYWTASSSFNQGACGVETAATDLGYAKADVTAAFNVVGVSCSGGGGGGGTTVLTKGVALTGQGASSGNSLNYTLAVPSGATNLTFTMSGGSGDGDLYVKFGSAPTDSSYDCRPYKSGNSESCSFASPSAGTYYVRIKAYSTFSGVSLVGNYTSGASNTAPVANFTFTTSGLTANFTDTSTDAQGNISSRSWNFGDGSTSTSTNPSHTYSANGTYTVTETVTDSGGLSSTKSASVTVSGGGGGSCGGTVLCSGTAVALPSVSTSSWSSTYTMPVTAGHTVTFTISGGTGDADLYVRAGSAPSTSSYNCRPYLTGNNETCTFTPSSNTTYYVRVRAYAAFSGVSLKGTSN